MAVRLRLRRAAAAFSLALALAACSADGQRHAAEEPPAGPAAAPTLAAVPRTQPEPPAPPPPPPELLGLDQAEVFRILGDPVFRRHDAPALLLRYRGSGCILDLFLYDSADRNQPGRTTVEHVEARTEEGRQTLAASCIAEVLRAKAGRTS